MPPMFTKDFRFKDGRIFQMDTIQNLQEDADNIEKDLLDKLKAEGVSDPESYLQIITICFSTAALMLREMKYELHRKWNQEAMDAAGVTGREF